MRALLVLLFVALVVVSCVSSDAVDDAVGAAAADDDVQEGGCSGSIVSGFIANEDRFFLLPEGELNLQFRLPEGDEKIFISGAERVHRLPSLEHQTFPFNKPGQYRLTLVCDGGSHSAILNIAEADFARQALEHITSGTYTLDPVTGSGVVKSIKVKNNSALPVEGLKIAGAEGLSGYSRDGRLERLSERFWENSTLQGDLYEVSGGIWDLFLNQLQEFPPEPGDVEVEGWLCQPFASVAGTETCGGQAKVFCEDFSAILGGGDGFCRLVHLQDHIISSPCVEGNLETGECSRWGTVDSYLGVIPYLDGEMTPPDVVRDNLDAVDILSTVDGDVLGGEGFASDFVSSISTFPQEGGLEDYFSGEECSGVLQDGGWYIPPNGELTWSMEATGFLSVPDCILDGSCQGEYRPGSVRLSVPVFSGESVYFGDSVTGYNALVMECPDHEGTVSGVLSLNEEEESHEFDLPLLGGQADLTSYFPASMVRDISVELNEAPEGCVVSAFAQTNGQFQPWIDAEHNELSIDFTGAEAVDVEIARLSTVDRVDEVKVSSTVPLIEGNGYDAVLFNVWPIAVSAEGKPYFARGHKVELYAEEEGVKFFPPRDLPRWHPGQPYSLFVPFGVERSIRNDWSGRWLMTAGPDSPEKLHVRVLLDGKPTEFLHKGDVVSYIPVIVK